jgi:hypothetical protein
MSIELPRERKEHSSNVPVLVETAAMVFCWSFAFLLLHPVPTLFYFPLEHRWSFESHPTGLAMDWYGRMLMSFAFSAVSGGIAWMVMRRRAPLSPEIQDGWLGAMVVSLVFVMLVIVVTSLGRHPVPEPVPSWYVPN